MNQFTSIKPIVKKVEANGKKLVIGTVGRADFTVKFDKLKGELSNNALLALYDGLSSVIYANAKDASGKIEIKLEISDNIPEEVTKNSDQAYKIEVTSDNISIIGYGEAGLYYAVDTFLQTVKVENNEILVPEMTLVDFPDLKYRGLFFETRFGSNLMTLDDWKAVVDNMASMKFNKLNISLYGCWNMQYDSEISEYMYVSVPKYPLLKTHVKKKYYSPKKGGWVNEVVDMPPMAKDDYLGELIKYGKSKGVEVFPLWNSLGHNTLIPRMYPETAPIVNGKRSRVGFCVSSPKTYEILFDIYDTIINKYLAPNGITSFHVGLDEVRMERGLNPDDPFEVYSPWCECEECSKLTNQEKTVKHAIKLISYLKSRGMKNVYMYNDLLSRIFKEPEVFKNALEKADLLDVAVVDWWSYKNTRERNIVKTTYPELGLRSSVKPWNAYSHWNVIMDSVPNVYYMLDMANRENCDELLSYCAWDLTCDINHAAMADYSWNFAATGSVEEYRERYALRNFPNQYEKAKRAFELFAALTEEGNSLPGSPNADIDDFSCGPLVKEILSYYNYGYVRPGLPYPRNFPGEGVNKIMDSREKVEQKLKEFSSLANEAYEIFTALKEDATGSAHLARRYAAEMRNYRDMIDDYLALLLINDASLEKNTEKVAKIAKERKLERLSLIAEMEDFKEEYLHASHLRNQSIFMQLFADIEAYANKTAPEDFDLDVCDMRKIGSDLFYGLRI